MNDIIVDIDVIAPSTVTANVELMVPTGVTADAEYLIPVEYVEIPLQPDLFRHNTLAVIDGTYQYIGQAPYGSNEEDAVWKVTRIIYDVTGKKVVSQIWNNQKWSDYKN